MRTRARAAGDMCAEAKVPPCRTPNARATAEARTTKANRRMRRSAHSQAARSKQGKDAGVAIVLRTWPPRGRSHAQLRSRTENGRYWARTSDPQLVELVLSQLS